MTAQVERFQSSIRRAARRTRRLRWGTLQLGLLAGVVMLACHQASGYLYQVTVPAARGFKHPWVGPDWAITLAEWKDLLILTGAVGVMSAAVATVIYLAWQRERLGTELRVLEPADRERLWRALENDACPEARRLAAALARDLHRDGGRREVTPASAPEGRGDEVAGPR